MISHVTVGTNDSSRSIPFFEAVLGTIGISKMYEPPRGGALFGKNGLPVLGVVRPFNDEAATVGNGVTIAFALESREAVDAIHAKALELGGTDEGAPGERAPNVYMAYFRDLEGNKFAAGFRG